MSNRHDLPRLDPLARVIVAALRHVLPAHLTADIIGDLVEDYSRRSRGRRRWLIGQAWNLAWGFRRDRASAHAPDQPRALLTDVWLRDVRYAARSLFRSRGFAAVALLSLALGIGVATAVFSVVDGILLRPLPYGDADEIVGLREVIPGRTVGMDALPRSLLRQLVTGSRTLRAVAPFAITDIRVTAVDEPVVAVRVDVGARFFDVLRTSPTQGRLLGQADDAADAPSVAVLSHAFWRRVFGSDPAAVGRRIRVDDHPAEVVGVLPASFAFPTADAAIYMPGRWRWHDAADGVARAFMGPTLDVVARMRAGTAPLDVEREMAEWAVTVRKPHAPTAITETTFRATPIGDALVQGVRPALLVLVAAVACVLAIVCVNLTNLLLARGTVRQREMALRAALGASRWGMTRPLVLEGVLLSVLGGAAGLFIGWLLIEVVPLAASIDPTLAAQVRIDIRVLIFTLTVSAAIGAGVGVLPAWQMPMADVRSAVSGGRLQVLPGAALSAEQLRSGLVVLQISLAIVLAIAAALLSRSLVTLLAVDLGFDPAQTLAVQVKLPPNGGTGYDWRARFYEQFVERLSAHPGVSTVGFSTSLPARETFSLSSLRIDGVATPPEMPFRAHREVVTPGYFAAIGLRVVRGRALLPTDTASSERVLVVNEAFAETFLVGRDAIGQLVMVFGDWHRIVGVARSKRQAGLRSPVRPEMYVVLAQAPADVVSQFGSGVVLRVTGTPADVLPFVRRTLHGLQPRAVVEYGAALEEEIWASTAQPRFYASVMGAFAVLALVTALVGLFGVLSYVVERRRVEIGVRRALGATAADISRLVVERGLRLVVLALPCGLAGAYVGSRLLGTLLFGIQSADVPTFAVVLATVCVVSLVACAWPARRAVRIAPLDALRED